MPRFNGVPVEQETKASQPRFQGVPVDQESGEDGFSATEMLSNVPSSAYKLGENLVTAVVNPIDTAKAMGGAAAGGLYKANEAAKDVLPDFMTRPITGSEQAFGYKQEPYADAVVQGVKSRYGSKDNALQTLEDDPVGVMADLAGVLTGAGGLAKSSSLTKAGAAINPINATINTAKAATGKLVPKNLPATLYEQVAKFSTTIPEKTRKTMVETALKYGVMPTAKGAEKLESLIGGFNQKLDSLITGSKGAIPRQAIYKHLKDLRQQKGGVRLEAAEDLEAINRVVRSFELHMKKLDKKEKLTAADLQKLKTEAYKSINWDAKRMTGAPIKEDVYKNIARGAKEGVEQLEPGVKQVNQELGKLYELQPSLTRSAARIENRNIVPIDVPLQIAAGGTAGGPVGSAVGTATSIAGIPKLKARTALGLQSLRDNAGLQQFLQNNPNLSAIELALILSGRMPTEADLSAQQ